MFIRDAKLAASLRALCAKGEWILCRDVLLVPGALPTLDALSTIEKVALCQQLPRGVRVAGRLLVEGLGSGPVTCAWARPLNAVADISAASDGNEVVAGRQDVALPIPLLARDVEVPHGARLDTGLRASLGSLEAAITQARPPLCSLLWVSGTLSGIGFARRVHSGFEGPQTGAAAAWVFSGAEEAAKLSVGEAMTIARSEVDCRDIALEVVLAANGATVRIRTRFHDFLRLAGFATAREPVLTAVQRLGPVRVACLVEAHQLHDLRAHSDERRRTRAPASAPSEPIHLTSLQLLDENNASLVEEDM